MQYVNIVTRYEFPLFSQHYSTAELNSNILFFENSEEDREWDLVIVFDGVPATRMIRVKNEGLIFVAGEPPDAMRYTREFLDQFDISFCAHPYARRRGTNKPDQYFNNWHFGYDSSNREFKWSLEHLRDMAPPVKSKDMSVIMSNLAYMPNHLKRRRFLEKLQERFGQRVDVFGRGERYIPYKDDALLPYRFHLCIENCAVPDLWTEKLADPLLGWAVPVYAGCPNLSRYIPEESFVRLDMDDVEGSLTTIDRLLNDTQSEYGRRLGALRVARQRILKDHNIVTLAERVLAMAGGAEGMTRTLVPNEQTRGFKWANYALRLNRYIYRRYFLLTHGSPNKSSSDTKPRADSK